MSNNIEIKVSTDRLKEVAGDVNTQIDRAGNAFSAIEQTVKSASSYWEGEGHNAQFNAYFRRLEQIQVALRRFRENVTDLEKIAGIYEATEAEATELTSSLPNNIID